MGIASHPSVIQEDIQPQAEEVQGPPTYNHNNLVKKFGRLGFKPGSAVLWPESTNIRLLSVVIDLPLWI